MGYIQGATGRGNGVEEGVIIKLLAAGWIGPGAAGVRQESSGWLFGDANRTCDSLPRDTCRTGN